MATQVDHILLTRFNLPSDGMESTIRNQDGWLEGRVRLFEEYCLPSVRAQREQNFAWIIYFDPQSPEWLKAWIETTHPGSFTPIFRARVPTDDLRADLESVVPAKSRWLMTTNLDNDDGLGRDFVGRLQGTRSEARRAAVYLSRGLIKSADGLFLRTDRHNAFCSVRETWDAPVTCWADWHNRLPLSMPAEVHGGQPSWLQVVHATNVSNRIRGRRVSPRPYRDDFVGLESLSEPTGLEILGDRLGRTPARAIRDASRATARNVAVSLLGKDGVDRAKARVARRRAAT
jgi:hypothetical protein